VIITEEAQAGKHWQEPEIAPGYSRLSAFDYYRQEAALHPYDVLEVKAILTEGPEKIEKMLRTEVGHFLRQLTWLTIWWDKNRKGDFPFPERLIIAHLRGSSPHLFYSMPLNPWFFEQWINALEERRQSLRKSIPEYESPLDLSKNQWPVAMRAKIETRETETFMDILIRGQKITAQKEQETKDKGGEVKQWKQWKLP
jgi:hypothetical protein